jgi:Fe-S-cluster containining protein
MMLWSDRRHAILAETVSLRRFTHDAIQVFLDEHPIPGRLSVCSRCTKPYCCNMIVAITLIDAIPIAEKMMNNPNIPRLLAEQAAQQRAIASMDGWFDHAEPCIFLDSNLRCSIYDLRPLPCREHLAWSDPDHCAGSPDLITSCLPSLGQIALLREAAGFERDVLKLDRPLPYIDNLPSSIDTAIRALRATTEEEFKRILSTAPTMSRREGSKFARTLRQPSGTSAADFEYLDMETVRREMETRR